jgi:hypothetical protein
MNKRDLRACSTRVDNPSVSGATSPSVRCQKSFGHRRLCAHLINQRAENSFKSEEVRTAVPSAPWRASVRHYRQAFGMPAGGIYLRSSSEVTL